MKLWNCYGETRSWMTSQMYDVMNNAPRHLGLPRTSLSGVRFADPGHPCPGTRTSLSYYPDILVRSPRTRMSALYRCTGDEYINDTLRCSARSQ